jgi:Flp pilus assembly pilin Flp
MLKLYHSIPEEVRKLIKTGQTMTEYALILAAIAIVAIVAYTTLGTSITTLVNSVIACM